VIPVEVNRRAGSDVAARHLELAVVVAAVEAIRREDQVALGVAPHDACVGIEGAGKVGDGVGAVVHRRYQHVA
jgi:hypothetical protein